jgi:hypothetical protein
MEELEKSKNLKSPLGDLGVVLLACSNKESG